MIANNWLRCLFWFLLSFCQAVSQLYASEEPDKYRVHVIAQVPSPRVSLCMLCRKFFSSGQSDWWLLVGWACGIQPLVLLEDDDQVSIPCLRESEILLESLLLSSHVVLQRRRLQRSWSSCIQLAM
jgi:hypothetical protein